MNIEEKVMYYVVYHSQFFFLWLDYHRFL